VEVADVEIAHSSSREYLDSKNFWQQEFLVRRISDRHVSPVHATDECPQKGPNLAAKAQVLNQHTDHGE
jgi:predicted nuclease of restriction endonuclease-like RecB superfamily